MNVLILTPDAVGSTLLQRLITIQMLLSDFDQPVINLHELTNGLEKVFDMGLDRELVKKPTQKAWGYYQSLGEIVEMLDSVDHYKVSRLAHYHILNRSDSLQDQIPFYQYLNDNFFIIKSHRKNVFEHALSWGINAITKKLNVYSPEEKLRTFHNFYKDPISIDTKSFVGHLNSYKNYLKWADTYFKIGSYYTYEDHVPNVESYILGLPIFAGREKKTWNDVWGLTFGEFNLCHHSRADIGAVALAAADQVPLLTYDNLNKTVLDFYPENKKQIVLAKQKEYQKAQQTIEHMAKLGLLVSPLPIKKMSLKEKRFVIKNFDECLNVYNDWAVNHSDGCAEPYTEDRIKLSLDNEKIID